MTLELNFKDFPNFISYNAMICKRPLLWVTTSEFENKAVPKSLAYRQMCVITPTEQENCIEKQF